MKRSTFNSPDTYGVSGKYSQAVAVTDAQRTLYVSGQVPLDLKDNVPADFVSQCRLVWRNIGAQLTAAGMSTGDIIKVTTFLSDRRYRDENSIIRQEVLGENAPALTIIICDIYDPAWLLEIEVIAAQ